jgi:AcrR family transcriptional regulator
VTNTAPLTTKERILEVSSELFRRQGLHGTGIKQILTAANAPFGSLYHHFPGGKDQLAAATIARAGAFYAALVFEHLTSEPDPVESIRAAFLAAGETLRTTDYADACPIETIALEVASTNETLRIATAEVFESWVQGMAMWLEAGGVEPGASRPLAFAILSALEGAFVFCRASRTTEALEATADAMAALVAAALSSSSR